MNLFTKRFGLVLGGVVGVGAIAALVIGATFALFNATSGPGSQTFTAGTVSLNSPTSIGCNTDVTNLEPGDTGTCYFQAQYTGNLPAYIGAEATSSSFPDMTYTINGTTQTSANPVLIGNSVTGGSAYDGAPPPPSGDFDADVVWTFSSGAGNADQGDTGSVYVTFYAVQCSNNGANSDGSLSTDSNESCQDATPASWTQTPASSSEVPVYDSLLAGNDYAWNISDGSTQLGQLGLAVTPSSATGDFGDVVVALSSYSPAASGPVTLNIYSTSNQATPLVSDTETVNFPAGTSSLPTQFNVTFDLTSFAYAVPAAFVYGVVLESEEYPSESDINVNLSQAPPSVGTDTDPDTAYAELDPLATYDGVGGDGVAPENIGQVTCTPLTVGFNSYSTATTGTWTGPSPTFGPWGGPDCGMGPFVPAVEFFES